ncbi:MAG: tyrosine recombinase XerC [Chthoniobacteraceae bacterium]|nr:tyrosine recombinase XerC [Chthoniobacteraceae bacterium]
MKSSADAVLSKVMAAAEQRQLSQNTLTAYRRTWLKVIAWSGTEGLALSTLSKDQADRFYREITRERSAAHHLQVKAALQLLYKTLDAVNPFSESHAPKFRIENTEIRYLPAAALSALLLKLRNTQDDYFGRLTYHLSLALFYTACRFHEWASLDLDQLVYRGDRDIEAVKMKVKGGKLREVPIAPALALSLAEWLEFLSSIRGTRLRGGGLGFAASPLIFPGRDGAPPSNQAFNRRLAEACAQAKVPQISAHGLRHSAATLLLNDKGKNLREVQALLGHVSLATTARYTRVNHTRLRAIVGDLKL